MKAESHETGALINERGFTLLELLIVIFLISLMLGISTVYFANSLPASRFKATVREMSSVMRHARVLARSSGEDRVLLIDMDAGSYAIEGAVAKTLPRDIKVKVMDPFEGELGSGIYRLVFRPMGAMDGAGIILSGPKRSATIELDPIVGAVVVK